MADVFTVSTDEMKEAYLHLRTDTHVLPNAIYLEEMASEFNGHHKEQQGKKFEFPLVLWRGGQYGMRDVWENVGDLSKISGYTARNNGTVAWMGSVPPFLDGDLQVLEWVNVNMFFDNLRVLRPDYIWKPLSKTQFNSCKSNIALLEATVAGALCIGGDGTDKWRPAIKPEQIENDMSWKRKRFEEQRKFVAEHFDIEKVNVDRAAILAGLFR